MYLNKNVFDQIVEYSRPMLQQSKLDFYMMITAKALGALMEGAMLISSGTFSRSEREDVNRGYS